MKDRRLITIDYPSYYIILPFIVPVFRVMRSLSLKYLEANDKIKDHPIITICRMFLDEIIRAVLISGSIK